MGNTALGSCYTKNPVSPSVPAPLHALRAQTTVRPSNKCAPPKSSNSLAVACFPQNQGTGHGSVVVPSEWKEKKARKGDNQRFLCTVLQIKEQMFKC